MASAPLSSIKDTTAIVGVATTAFSRDSGRTEYSLACEAIKAACDDAGLDLGDVDALVKDVADGIDPMYVQKAVGIDNLTYASESQFGTCAMMNAVTALAAGLCKYVVYYRSINGSSMRRAGTDFKAAKETKDDSQDLLRYDFQAPFGLLTPEGAVAMTLQRYLADHGIAREALGWIPVVCSENAAKNPHAIFADSPLSLADYAESAVRVEPMRAADCAPAADGAVAVVLTSAERARDLRQRPAVVMSVAQGTSTNGEPLSSYNRADIASLPEMKLMADELFAVAGIDRSDVSVAQLDDRFAPLVALQLEELGYCAKGEGVAYCEGGDRIRAGGSLPINTNGGFLGDGFVYGANVVEAVHQIRGTSPNQVDGADIALVASGAGGPADGLILRG
ncbi:MAG: lipid-transfer protein [Acidimicrobiia bacterium]